MEKKYNNCQSCGMPLKQDEEGGGTNEDGSLSRKFCSYCYKDGMFLQPDMTVDEMKELVKGKMKEMGYPKFLGWLVSFGIPKLERWKK